MKLYDGNQEFEIDINSVRITPALLKRVRPVFDRAQATGRNAALTRAMLTHPDLLKVFTTGGGVKAGVSVEDAQAALLQYPDVMNAMMYPETEFDTSDETLAALFEWVQAMAESIVLESKQAKLVKSPVLKEGEFTQFWNQQDSEEVRRAAASFRDRHKLRTQAG